MEILKMMPSFFHTKFFLLLFFLLLNICFILFPFLALLILLKIKKVSWLVLKRVPWINLLCIFINISYILWQNQPLSSAVLDKHLVWVNTSWLTILCCLGVFYWRYSALVCHHLIKGDMLTKWSQHQCQPSNADTVAHSHKLI